MTNYVWAFDIGGTSIKHSLFHQERIILEGNEAIDQSVGGPSIVKILKTIMDRNPLNEGFGISLAAPGIIDPDSGIVISCSDTIKNYLNTDYKKELKQYSPSVVVDNDVNVAILGEYEERVGINSMYQINIGTGVGGAFVFEKKVLSGHDYLAGDIGSLIINGNRLDETGSTRGLLNSIKAKNKNFNLNGRQLVEAVEYGDKKYDAEVNKFIDSIGKTISIVVNLFNPELIVIGGGISESENFILNRLKQWDKENNTFKNTKIECAKLGNKAGIYGAFINYIEKSG